MTSHLIRSTKLKRHSDESKSSVLEACLLQADTPSMSKFAAAQTKFVAELFIETLFLLQIRELVVEYSEAKVLDVKLKRGLADLSLTFLRGSIFGHPSLPVMGRFNRIHVGANCPKSRLRDLLRLLKPGPPISPPPQPPTYFLLVVQSFFFITQKQITCILSSHKLTICELERSEVAQRGQSD